MLAGIIQGNVRQSPYVNMDAAVRRRNYTLDRMANEGFISTEQAEEAKTKPIVVRGEPRQPPSIAPYFLEEVRKHLETRYGAKRLYESGLSVKTTLDPVLQDAANRAVAAGLRRIDKKRGYRRATRNVLAEKQTPQGFAHERWTRTMAPGDVVPAVVTAVGRAPAAGGIKVRIGRYQADLTRESFSEWPRPPSPASFAVGDLIEVGLMSLNEGTKQATVTLEQTPLVEGALVAIDNRTGQIRAMVGGWSFSRSKFNRAMQAYRQLGSTFKPIVYTAAIDRGLTPATLIVDQPVSYPAGSGGLYEPQNYDHKFEGPVTLRRALEQSRNIPAIKMMEEVGPSNVVSYARRFGFSREFPPYLPIALGAGEGTLLEVTSAYSVFPNRGVRAKPYFIQTVTDRAGNLLEEGRIEPVNVIRADTAFMMTSLLEGVVRRGTGEAASSIEWPLAGKTGTVDDNTDAWFVGFDPDITVGVWTGHDAKKTMGANETGAVAALPIWMDFMKAYVATRTDPPSFVAPENIVFLPVDRATGAVVPSQTPGAITETFIAGTQPGGIDVELASNAAPHASAPRSPARRRPEPLQPAIQRPAADAEQPRGFGLVAADARQDTLDLPSLSARQEVCLSPLIMRLGGGACDRFAGRRGDGGEDLALTQQARIAHRAGALDDIFQLTDVPVPAGMLQDPFGGRRDTRNHAIRTEGVLIEKGGRQERDVFAAFP